MSTNWRDRVRARPAIPVGADGGPPSDEEVREWRYEQERAEREHERELQAKATAEELCDLVEAARREETLGWMRTIKENAEQAIAKNLASAAALPPTVKPKKKRGRPSNAIADSKALREIRAKNPKSDGWTIFKNRLTTSPDKGKQRSIPTARRRYLKADSILLTEK